MTTKKLIEIEKIEELYQKNENYSKLAFIAWINSLIFPL